MASVSESVGQNRKNRPNDIKTVQVLAKPCSRAHGTSFTPPGFLDELKKKLGEVVPVPLTAHHLSVAK
jgi:hypothetical protein